MAGGSVPDSVYRIMEEYDPISLRAFRIRRKPNFAPSLEELRKRLENSEEGSKAFTDSALTFSESLSRLLSSVKQNPHLKVSKTPLNELERTSLVNLRLLQRAKKGYLILRTLQAASPSRNHGIKTIVEDHEGTVVVFVVFNLTDEPNPNLHIVLPIGTVVVLKEPYIDETEYGECFLRCESPSDLIVLYREHEYFALCEGIFWRNVIVSEVDLFWGHPMPQNALQWKSRGNVLRQYGQYNRAISCYLLSLKYVNGSARDQQLRLVVRLELSSLYYQHGFFESALKVAKEILEGDPCHLDTLILAGRSCYKLRKYAKAKTYFQKFYIFSSNSKYIERELDICQARLMEQQTGVFDMFEMFSKQLRKPRMPIDSADYVGPIKFQTRPYKYTKHKKPKEPKTGFAMIATRDIEPGTILVVSKALAFSWRPKSAGVQRPFNYLHLIARLTQMIAKNPETYGEMIFSLPGMHGLVDKSPPKVFCDPETKMEPIVDVIKLKEIILRNILGDSDDVSRVNRLIQQGKIHKSGFGLFVMPSYITFGCVPNTSVHEFNDVLVVRAVQWIRKENQVFLPDAVSRVELSFRQTLMSPRRRNFCSCNCRICILDKNEPLGILSHRRCLVETLELIYDKVNQINSCEIVDRNVHAQLASLIVQMEGVLRQLEFTYQRAESIYDKLDMSSVYTMMAVTHSKQFRTDYIKLARVILCMEIALKCLGFDPNVMLSSMDKNSILIEANLVLNPTTIFVVCGLVLAHKHLNNVEVRNKWTRILCILESVYSGGDARVVNLRYPNCINVSSQNNIFKEFKGF